MVRDIIQAALGDPPFSLRPKGLRNTHETEAVQEETDEGGDSIIGATLLEFSDDGTRGTIAMCSWLFLGIRGYDKRFEFGYEPDMLWRLSAVGRVARELRANVVGSDIPNPGDECIFP